MRIGTQLYTLRDPLAADTAGSLARLAQIGCRYVETAGLHGLDPAAFRALLDENGLHTISCHVGLGDLEGRLAETVVMAQTLGAGLLVVPAVGESEYGPGWDKLGARFTAVADSLKPFGLRFAYHNHSFEFDLQEGVPGYERLWSTNPRGLHAELDLYWAWRAGQDPAAWLRRIEGRVPLTHFKDGDKDRFLPVGQGELDWGAIIPAAREAGVEYAIIELDQSPGDPFDAVAESFEFLRSRGLDT
ncbi:MAG: sugar phosphate isomerase/epimerase [Fimbriimonadaceae bacterium]|nr:sugar phosphate isomerase/epimerase [Fimbriimonadaceae bacterium]QYK56828.1 MAG: sugar phosphate isomerase/epimerase [Fimbriimonadaceae bacterium]